MCFIIRFHGLKLIILEDVYIPSEDTFQILECVESYLKSTRYMVEYALDMGCGCGVLGLYIALKCRRIRLVDLVDIDPRAIQNAILNAFINGLRGKCRFYLSNLFEKIPMDVRYDLIVFNPPYLEPLGYLNHTVEGGPYLVKDFLEKAVYYMSDRGVIIVLIPKENLNFIRKELADVFKVEILRESQFFEEKLVCLKIYRVS